MPILRITKKYNAYSNGLAGIIELDKIKFATKEEGAGFLLAVAKTPHCGYIILEADWALVDIARGAEVIENPTGGFTGKVTDARQYGV